MHKAWPSCLACQHFLLIWTNHKLRKKLGNKNGYICPCSSVGNTILCTNSQTLHTEGLECVTQATVYPHLKDTSRCKSQIVSYVVPFPSPPPPPAKKLSLPIQPSQSPNRIGSDLTGNKKMVSLWQAEAEICRLQVAGHTGSFVFK